MIPEENAPKDTNLKTPSTKNTNQYQQLDMSQKYINTEECADPFDQLFKNRKKLSKTRPRSSVQARKKSKKSVKWSKSTDVTV